MKIFFDTEFIEDGRTIDLLSIGAVREDGEEFYAEFAGVDLGKANVWVQDNVLPLLTGLKQPRKKVAQDFNEFAGDHPEFWADYAAYDWVALCQLYGAMIDIPLGWPMFCFDIQAVGSRMGIDVDNMVPNTEVEHHALGDARHLAKKYEYLKGKKGF